MSSLSVEEWGKDGVRRGVEDGGRQDEFQSFPRWLCRPYRERYVRGAQIPR